MIQHAQHQGPEIGIPESKSVIQVISHVEIHAIQPENQSEELETLMSGIRRGQLQIDPETGETNPA